VPDPARGRREFVCVDSGGGARGQEGENHHQRYWGLVGFGMVHIHHNASMGALHGLGFENITQELGKNI
jgi:hypothetical protein